jgi:hypothetical protein
MLIWSDETMPGIATPVYMRLHEYTTKQHRQNLKHIREVMMDCGILFIEVVDGDLHLHYEYDNEDIIQREEFKEA